MGNNNSGHVNVTQGPPLWTQSLPRDAHRKRKSEKIQGGTKVLPERIPGQRLKPTENGRNLHVQGTISTRKLNDVSHPPPDYLPPLQQSPNHHSSMTALNNPNNLPPSSLYPPNSESNHSSRLGGSSAKSLARSEPDLRSSSPSSHVSLPSSPTSIIPHTVISESPTKGKIKSKKRYKAPPPPPQPLQASISFPLDRSDFVPSPNMSFENQSSISSPTSKSSKNKPKKMGLFKKRNESRMSNYEVEASEAPIEIAGKHRNIIMDGKGKQKERSITPTPIQISSHKELKERAKSLDNLQHEIRRSPENGLAASLHSLEIIDNDEKEESWQRMPYENNQRLKNGIAESGKNNEAHFNVEIQNKNHRRLSSMERKLYERQLLEHRSEGILSSPVGDPKRFDMLNDKPVSKHRHMSSSSCSSCTECNKQATKDEWDLAEEEWLEKKKKSDILQKEIVHVVKNLKRTSVSPEPEIKPSLVNRKEIHIPSNNLVRAHVNDRIDAEDLPKTFFFGMDPGDRILKHDVESPLKTNTALSKLNDQDEVKIIGSSVEYSRHSLKPKEKRRSLEREHWNRSLDYRESRTRNSRSKEKDYENSRTDGKKKISKEVDEFAATIEREKMKQRPVDELSNSISRKGDGGYHSRQNSGSFNLGNEGSDEDNLIRMNLRPTLPRRQLELPRFSPNAAWRLLSVETSGKQKELQCEVTHNDDHFNISEDRIHRYTRPTAPPRASGEKSADSGISGDAGSPGPLQEFEPLAPQVKVTHGPLAVSSPVASGRIDIKRAWTPAQDLDDNSFEEHNNEANGKGSLHYEVSTMPKLTSRSNMFCKQSLHSSRTVDEEEFNEFPIEIEPPHPFSDNLQSQVKHKSEDYQVDAKSLQRSKKSLSSHKTSNLVREDLPETPHDDDWRENWSMSRSIPNSLNAFDDRDCVDGTSAPCRSKSESRVSLSQLSDNKSQGIASKTSVPGYMNRGNSGHIMYLPEYKSYQLSRENLNHIDSGERIGVSTPEEEERKSPSGDENPEDPESLQWNIERQAIGDPEQMSKGKRFIVLNGKKNKKFSYQSTVRMMEKKKLEDKLSKEVEEKEKRRIQEMEAMMKVEQEFQEKREREKKRLKQQLQLFQEQQHQDHKQLEQQQKESNSVNNYGGKPASPREIFNTCERLEKLDKFDESFSDIDQPHRALSPTPSSQSPAPPFTGHRQKSSYQSLPMELVNSNGYPGANYQNNSQSGLLSGFKNWVKGKKDPKLGRESRSGYLSDASSVTVNSTSRQEPDGAPASSPSGRKNLDSIRAEIIAGSRHRNGIMIGERETSTPSSGRYRGDSPVPSILSKESHRRTITPDSRRPVSPESRKSAASEGFPLTQELPEMRQEQRQYREYRRSARKNFLPSLGGQIKPSNKASPATHNYRRDFCLGNLSSTRALHPQENISLYARNPNENHKSSKHKKRNHPMDPDGGGPQLMTHSLRRQYSSKGLPVRHSVPMPIPPHHGHRNGFRVISPPFVNKGFPPPHAAQYSPSRGYRPVSYPSPTQGNILTVT